MPLPLIPLAVATFAGWKFGATVERKVRGLFSRAPASQSIALDPTLPADMRGEVESLLSNVKDPGLLEYASNYYKAQGFPGAANALAARASIFLKGASHG